jgi:hypothetical protein
MGRTFFTLIHAAEVAGDPAPLPAEPGDGTASAHDSPFDSRRILVFAPNKGEQSHEETGSS